MKIPISVINTQAILQTMQDFIVDAMGQEAFNEKFKEYVKIYTERAEQST